MSAQSFDFVDFMDNLGGMFTREWAVRTNTGALSMWYSDPDVAQVGIGDLRDKGLEPRLVWRLVSEPREVAE